MDKSLIRFLKYFIVGFSTFSFDLFILFLFTDIFLFNYLISVGLAYLIAVSINYYLSRKFVFSKTIRSVDKGYYGFLAISIIGLIFVVIQMWFFVEILNLNYFYSRILVAAVVGIWNYLMNLFVNFNVAGKH